MRRSRRGHVDSGEVGSVGGGVNWEAVLPFIRNNDKTFHGNILMCKWTNETVLAGFMSV